MMRAIRHRLPWLGRDEGGAAAIEFGMIAPIFFALLLGIIDIGRYMWTLNTMQYALDDAVRAGVVRQLTESEITGWLKESLAGLNTGAVNVGVDIGVSTVSVTADTTYSFLFPISSFMDSTTISLRTEMPK
jgi:Flp pilus assembly protein TadG